MAKKPSSFEAIAPVATEVPEASPAQRLDDIIAALDPGLMQDPAMLTNQPSFVPQSEILMPDQGALSNSMTAAAAANPKLASLSPQYAAQMAQIDQALNHSEQVKTMPATFAIGTTAVQMPREVRDKANSLYQQRGRDGKIHYVKERAELLTKAIFGPELAPRVLLAAAMRGFSEKPMLWIGQTLWLHIEMDMPHTFTGEATFEPSVDESPASRVLEALNTCFYHLTVRNISRIASKQNIGALDVVRSILKDICDEMHVRVPSVEVAKV